MALTISDILDCTSLASARVLAGRKGLDREISSVTVGEVPDIGDWLTGQEIVLSTFFATTADRDSRAQFVRKIIKSGASALIAKPGRYIGSIDPEIIVLANSYDFPVIEVTEGIRWTHIIQQVTERILGDHVSVLRRSEQIHKRLLGLVLDGGDLQDIVVAAADVLHSPIAIFDTFGRLTAAADHAGKGRIHHPVSETAGNVDGKTEHQTAAAIPSVNDLIDVDVGLTLPPEAELRSAREPIPFRANGRDALAQPVVAGSEIIGAVVMLTGGAVTQPLDIVALEHTATVAAVEMGRLRIQLETEMRMRGDFLDDLLDSRLLTTEALLERASYLGGDLQKGGIALIASVDRFDNYVAESGLQQRRAEQLRTELFQASAQAISERHQHALVMLKRNQIIAFLPGTPGADAATMLAATRITGSRLASVLARRFPDLDLRIALGRYYSDPIKMEASFREAEIALRIGSLLWGETSATAGDGEAKAASVADVVAFDDVGAYKLLMRLLETDPGEFETFYQESMAAIARYDQGHNTSLVETLDKYFHCHENIAETAKKLFTHRHTVRYRLGRIAEISGLDVARSEDREKLSLGLKAHRLRAAWQNR